MDNSSSSWFSWMTRSTIHERNVARRNRTVQNRHDTRPVLLRIGSVLTTKQPKAPDHMPVVQKLTSIERGDTFLAADEIMLRTLFDDESSVLAFDESIASPVAPSIHPNTSSFPRIPMSWTLTGILGSWMVLRHTHALPRFHPTSKPLAYAMLAPLQAPHLGIPVSVGRHAPEGMISNHASRSKLTSFLVRSMQTSWTSSSKKTRIPLVILLLTGYEVLTSAILGPRSPSDKH